MKILVTGGSGFIGSHLIDALSKSHEIINVDVKEPNDSKATFVNCDITDYSELAKNVGDKVRGFDAVIHLAALSREAESNTNPEIYFKVNVNGTINMLRIAKDFGVKNFIFASTYLVYGNPPVTPVNEDNPLKPGSIYASTKAASESICNSFHQIYGLNTIIFRQALVYGKNDLQKRVVTLFIDRAKQGKDITIFGNKILDFVYIDDVVDAYMKALNHNQSDTFNIASGRGMSLLELAESVQRIVNPNIKIIRDAEKVGDVNRFVADISKSQKLLGFNPTGDLIKFVESEK